MNLLLLLLLLFPTVPILSCSICHTQGCNFDMRSLSVCLNYCVHVTPTIQLDALIVRLCIHSFHGDLVGELYLVCGYKRDIVKLHELLTLKVLVTAIDAGREGMGDVGSARYEPALLPPCPTIRVLSYSN